MAIFTPGPTAAAISGSIGGTTYSHNRGGMYMRNRAIPTKATSVPAENQKARIALFSQAWGGLTEAQRLQWSTWANQNTITNALGAQITMSGHQAFVHINARLNFAGDAAIDSPPVGEAPAGLTALSGTWDIGAGTFELTFAPTPLEADERLLVWAAVVNSGGINYVRNLLKALTASALAQATAYDTQALIEARFGTLLVGQFIHMHCAVHSATTGLRSLPFSVEGTVVTT